MVQGSRYVLFKGSLPSRSKSVLLCLAVQAPIPKSALVPVIPITKSTGSRFRNSVEGLNQEIEIIIKETGDKEEQLVVRICHRDCSLSLLLLWSYKLYFAPFFFNFKIAWIFALLVNVFEKSHGKQKEELKLDSEHFSFVMAIT